MYKLADAQGLYAAVTRTGVISFRFDYRLNGRRETLVIGTYDSTLGARKTRDTDQLAYGQPVTLAEARQLQARAQREVQAGNSPSRAKSEKRREAAEALTFGAWATKYFAEADLADSTKEMRRSVYVRNLANEFGRLKLEEITPAMLLARCERIKDRGAPAPAILACLLTRRLKRQLGKAAQDFFSRPAVDPKAQDPRGLAFDCRRRARDEGEPFADTAVGLAGREPSPELKVRERSSLLCFHVPSAP
ncbi:hypothetical protein J2X21_003458 [Kinneretia asaccharophila]|uniref:Integrase DNA-binding domain-containing protein n=1 Tax=Roseateles asaccharophilus TaxID=582607 RepID=A0ABU2AAW2_9BURK|nr:hypothetical protein [Roseateles asaccharophilus]